MSGPVKIKMIENLLEMIFHKKELKQLKELNEKLLAGDCVPLTSFERKMILDALIDPCYLSKIHNPNTK